MSVKQSGESQCVLVADDEPSFREALALRLEQMGYRSLQAEDGHRALEILRGQEVDVLITDLQMPGMAGMELLGALAHLARRPVAIVLTGFGDTETAVAATRLGAYDFVTKPIDSHRLEIVLARALEYRTLSRHNHRLIRRTEHAATLQGMIGKSAPMIEVFRSVLQVGPTNANVLVTGESGTGKELLARAIHDASRRKDEPFVVIDCSTIPENLFESVLFGHRRGAFTGASRDHTGLFAQADKGTAFFDEVGELPLAVQGKLLRAIQEGEYLPIGEMRPRRTGMRVVAATNRDLPRAVQQGTFREDLYYRLNVIHLEAPALRDRGTDIEELAFHFLYTLAPEDSHVVGISPDAVACLRNYAWPGNVRELRNAVEHAVHFAQHEELRPSDLPEPVRIAGEVFVPVLAPSIPTPDETWALCLQRSQREYLTQLLNRSGANISRAAQIAGVSRKTLYKMLRDVSIAPDDFR